MSLITNNIFETDFYIKSQTEIFIFKKYRHNYCIFEAEAEIRF